MNDYELREVAEQQRQAEAILNAATAVWRTAGNLIASIARIVRRGTTLLARHLRPD